MGFEVAEERQGASAMLRSVLCEIPKRKRIHVWHYRIRSSENWSGIGPEEVKEQGYPDDARRRVLMVESAGTNQPKVP